MTKHTYFGTSRSLKFKAKKNRACGTVTTQIDGGRKISFEVCTVGAKGGAPTLAITRIGRFFGSTRKNAYAKQAGMTACTSAPEAKCLRAKSVFLSPGGAGRYRKAKVNVLNGLRRKGRK